MLRISRFGGIFPKLAEDQLPEHAGTLARDCSLVSGALTIPPPFGPTSLADPIVPPAARLLIPAPDKPRRRSGGPNWMCKLAPSGAGAWLTMRAYGYAAHWDTGSEAGSPELNPLGNQMGGRACAITEVRHVSGGLQITAALGGTFGHNCAVNRSYSFYGPIFELRFTAADGLGGPIEACRIPLDLTAIEASGLANVPFTLPTIPSQSVPLYHAGQVYGHFQMRDYVGPSWRDDEEFIGEPGESVQRLFQGGTVTFFVDLNYVEPAHRSWRLIATHLDGDPEAGGNEGPPSEPSDLIVVEPGEALELEPLLASGYDHGRLYRSAAGSDRFLLLDELTSSNADPWTENGQAEQGVELPPSGTPPSADTNHDFWTRAIIHPAQFAATFQKADESWGAEWPAGHHLLALSDVFRWHAWPREQTLEFDEEITAIGLAGGTIIVFTAGKVYGVSGSNPAAMAVELISNAHPLAAAGMVCKVGATLYYATSSGIAAASAGGVQIVTRPHYRAEEWAAVLAGATGLEASDDALFLMSADGPKLRFDLAEDGLIAASTCTPAGTPGTAGAPTTWRSRRFVFDRRLALDYVRARIGGAGETGAATLTILTDNGAAVGPVTLADGMVTRLADATGAAAPWATEWSFEVKLTGPVGMRLEGLEFFERRVIALDGPLTLSPADGVLWESFWVQFPSPDRFVVGAVSAAEPVAVRLWKGGRAAATLAENGPTEVASHHAGDGNAFIIDRDLAAGDLWEVGISRAWDDPAGTAAEIAANEGPFTPIAIHSLQLLPRLAQAAERVIHEIHPGGGIAPWLSRRYEFPGEAEVVSVRVKAAKPVTLNLYPDGAAARAAAVTCADWSESLLTPALRCGSIEFDFGGDDAHVTEMMIFTRETIPISNQGLILREADGRQNWRGLILSFPDTGSFSVVRAVGSKYPVALTLTPHGGSACQVSIQNMDELRLPRSLPSARQWQLDVEHEESLRELHLIGTVRHPVEEGLVTVRYGAEPFSWLGHLLALPAPASFSAGRVLAENYPAIMTLHRGEREVWRRTVEGPAPFRLPALRPERTWEMNVIAPEGVLVHEASLATGMARLKV